MKELELPPWERLRTVRSGDPYLSELAKRLDKLTSDLVLDCEFYCDRLTQQTWGQACVGWGEDIYLPVSGVPSVKPLTDGDLDEMRKFSYISLFGTWPPVFPSLEVCPRLEASFSSHINDWGTDPTDEGLLLTVTPPNQPGTAVAAVWVRRLWPKRPDFQFSLRYGADEMAEDTFANQFLTSFLSFWDKRGDGALASLLSDRGPAVSRLRSNGFRIVEDRMGKFTLLRPRGASFTNSSSKLTDRFGESLWIP